MGAGYGKNLPGSDKLNGKMAQLYRELGFHSDVSDKKSFIWPDDANLFTDREISVLRDTFDEMKVNREDFARSLLHRVSLIEGVAAIYERNRNHKIGNRWSDIDLGTVLMNGIERFLLRLDRPASLIQACQHLTATHCSSYTVKSAMMIAALEGCQEVFLREFETKHGHSDIDDIGSLAIHNGNERHYSTGSDNSANSVEPTRQPAKASSPRSGCETCNTWEKFFTIISTIFTRC